MVYTIVYDSRTGNTEKLAHAIADALPSQDCMACGRLGEVDAEALEQVDLVFVGFWTNRADSSDAVAALLAQLSHKDVFLFGTAGFGLDDTYFTRVMACVAAHLPSSVHLAGTFMCQGKMPLSSRARYEQTAALDPQRAAHMQQRIANFDAAASHPDAGDIARLQAMVKALAR